MNRLVLISAESEHFSHMCCAVLNGYSYDSISIPQHGGKVLAAINEFSPDIVLMNFNMAWYNAIEVIKRVRENPNSKLPMFTVVYLSLREEYELHSNGIKNIFIKPVDIYYMIARIVATDKGGLLIGI